MGFATENIKCAADEIKYAKNFSVSALSAASKAGGGGR